jgi:hypothetical protein
MPRNMTRTPLSFEISVTGLSNSAAMIANPGIYVESALGSGIIDRTKAHEERTDDSHPSSTEDGGQEEELDFPAVSILYDWPTLSCRLDLPLCEASTN